ncbi:MAG TPA: alpha-hydroxy acid oxidase [Acidimicrobiia bacterium]|nr:alpha-hydroxy acid oxidase [Acidimicrobiia bacterium]
MDVDALAARARAEMEPSAWDYCAGGSDDEVTLGENVAAWRRMPLYPRVLRDVSIVDTSVEVLGVTSDLPFFVAPMAFQRLAHDDGEAGMARAAARAGTLMVVSTFATTSLEDVAAAASEAPRWFQLYAHADRGLTADLVSRAEAAGYRAIVLTVDAQVLGKRRRDEANRFALPEGLVPANLGREMSGGDGTGSALHADFAAAMDTTLSFDDLEWLAGLSDLPVVVKGVLRADDAAACVDHGVAAIAVSNHGGRQLDGAVATADALGPIVDAVGGRAPVLVDGGIRGGSDVVRALALGASAVMIGRPLLWGLAVGGEDGALGVLEELAVETRSAMALCGARSVAEIDRSLLSG